MSKRTVKRVQRIFRVVCAVGAMLLIGTAGASDAGQIEIAQLAAQAGAGLVMLTVGALFGGLLS